MMAYELKTKVNDASVMDFLSKVDNEQKRQDSFEILDMLKTITKLQPKMWGSSIIGFDTYSYKSKSGIEGEWMKIGFSPRKQSISLYLMCGFNDLQDLLGKLGKHKIGKGCLYINNLDDIDRKVLKELLKKAYAAKIKFC